MHIVICECDHDAFLEEEGEAARAGARLDIRQDHQPAEIIAGARDADGICVQYATITAAILDQLPKLRAIGRYGVGVDSVDIEAATQRGIAVCNVPDYGTEAVSDHAITLALAVSRGLTVVDRDLRAERFELPKVRPMYQIKDRVFGVIGLGRIGQAVARKAAGLGYRVIGHDALAAGLDSYQGIAAVSLDELLGRAQVVSLHVPLTDQTHHLINRETLAAMKKSAIVINPSRGAVIDTDALAEALQKGAIAGAGLDVYETEPLYDSPLFGMDNTVLTPHMGGLADREIHNVAMQAARNMVAFMTDANCTLCIV
jgi:D-3-phosphoglycerate dehydrogenase